MSAFHILALTPSDGMALSMVGLLGFSLGMILTILWVMARNAGRKPDVEEGLEDEEDRPFERPKAEKRQAKPRPPAQPWERDSDWWKNS